MPDNVTIVVDGTEIGGWSSVGLELSVDRFSIVDFVAAFDASDELQRETFRPFTFKPLKVRIDGELIFTGRVVHHAPSPNAGVSKLGISGYASPGTAADGTAPAAALPFEFRKLDLRAIADQLCAPFDFDAAFDADPGAPFDKVKLEHDGRVVDFLAELANQRSLVLSNRPNGDLLFWRSVAAGSPVARLSDREPVVGVEPGFSPQDYFSEITGFSLTKRGRVGSKHTVTNPHLDVLRPLSFTLADTDRGDAPAATKAKVGRMFANMCSYNVEVATWRDPNGNLWAPNTTVVLRYPDAMIYSDYEFLIRSVSFYQDADVTSARLNLVLPGGFAGEIPESLPWDG